MKKIITLLMILLTVGSISADKFEGVLKYRNFENHSKAVRNLSKGMAYNGARDMELLLKGNKILIKDMSMHYHVLIDPDAGSVVIFNDYIKKGLKSNYKKYAEQYLSGLTPKVTVEGQTKDFNIRETGESQTINDMKCNRYAGKLTVGVKGLKPVETDVDVWYAADIEVDPIIGAFLNGLPVPGIPVKLTVDQQGSVPIIGKMNSYIASELHSIEARPVEDSEFEIPADYEIKVTDSPFKMLSLYGQTTKYLKKNNMYPGAADKDSEVTYKIEEEWDF